MGMTMNEVRLMNLAKLRWGSFGRTIMLGRQEFHTPPRQLRQETGYEWEPGERFIDRLLAEVYGSTTTDSLDMSEFEGATVIHDLNEELPAALTGAYDTVIDFGTTEHVFNISEAMRSAYRLCAPRGVVLHSLPANNWCGHGMYQISPELFFSLYTRERGFDELALFLARVTGRGTKYWWRADRPEPGRRLQVNLGREPTVILCAARRMLETADLGAPVVYQSDYEHQWAVAEEDRGVADGIPPIRYRRTKSALQRARLLWLGERVAESSYRSRSAILRLAQRRRTTGLTRESAKAAGPKR